MANTGDWKSVIMASSSIFNSSTLTIWLPKYLDFPPKYMVLLNKSPHHFYNYTKRTLFFIFYNHTKLLSPHSPILLCFVNPSFREKPWHYTHSPQEIFPPIHLIIAKIEPVLCNHPRTHPMNPTPINVSGSLKRLKALSSVVPFHGTLHVVATPKIGPHHPTKIIVFLQGTTSKIHFL